MDLMQIRRHILMDTGQLPPIYRPVDYLESSGTQYIDTLVSGGGTNAYPAYTIDFMPLASTQTYQHYFCGMATPPSIPKLYREGANRPIALQNSTKFYPLAQDQHSFGTRYVVSVSNEDVTINGSAIDFPAVSGGGWGSLTWYIFSSHQESSLKSNMRLYGLKMYTDGKIVRNYIPCVRIRDTKPGLYDMVTRVFFINQGTGEFITP